MNFKKYVGMILVLAALASCNQNEYYLYNDVARIQFGPDPVRIYSASANLADTTKNFTFFYEAASVTQDTVFFDIYAIGGTSDKDRSFTLQQEQVGNGAVNAVAGTDYKAFSDPSLASHYVIKAGQVHTLVPVILFRTPTLKSTTLTLKFNVVEDNNFKLGEKSNLWRKIIFTDRLSQPQAWNATMTQYYLGTYSVTKHAFMILVTGEKWDQEFMTTLFSDMALFNFYISQCKTALTNYNNAHPGNPLKDENGQLVTFP